MKYLLDTHTLIWCFTDNDLLSEKALNLIVNPKNKKYVSIASLFEIAIKLKINRLNLGISYDDLFALIKNRKFTLLPIKQTHLNMYLSQQTYHKDPFDRLLIATAKAEDLQFISSDKDIKKYDVKIVW